MALALGDTAPDFTAETSEGPISFHEWIGDSWAVLFSHPKDFTPVCTTELGYMAEIKPEFDRRNVKIIGLSVDPAGKHEQWARDIEETQGTAPNYPIIADSDFNVSKLYGMLPASTSGDPANRTPADNQTVRNVFVIGPDKKVKLILVYPMTTGRNFDEVLRVIDSLQLTAKHRVATPVNWKSGDDVIIAGSVSDDEAKTISGGLEGAPSLHPHRAPAELTTGHPGRIRRLSRVRQPRRGGGRDRGRRPDRGPRELEAGQPEVPRRCHPHDVCSRRDLSRRRRPRPGRGRTPAPRGPGRRAHRRARRVLVWLAAAVVALTVASLLYNVATDGSASRPAGLTSSDRETRPATGRGAPARPVVLIPGALRPPTLSPRSARSWAPTTGCSRST